jgi:hypothetical protein
MTYDAINPNHYKGDRQFEPIEVIEDWGLNYHLGNALKYISRNGRKPGEDPREGLSKAIWYLERLQDKYDDEVACGCPPGCECEPCPDCLTPTEKMVSLTFAQDEIEFQALGRIPNSVLFGSDEDMIQAAQAVPFEATYEDILEFENWDPSLGPIEPDIDDQPLDYWGKDQPLSSQENWNSDALSSSACYPTFGKDLSKFSDTEIVHQSYEGGYIFGHQKNGDVRILGKSGEPVTTFDGDNAPSEYEPPLHDC